MTTAPCSPDAPCRRLPLRRGVHPYPYDRGERYGSSQEAMKNENFSLYVMCFFLLASLAFLAQQITAYH